MPSKGSEVKTARLSRETWASISELMEREEVTFSGAIKWLIENQKGSVPRKTEEKPKGVPQETCMTEETQRDLESMCKGCGISMTRFMDYISNLFNEGYIYVDGLEIKTRGEIDTRGFMEMCHRMNADPQEMIDKVTRSLQKG